MISFIVFFMKLKTPVLFFSQHFLVFTKQIIFYFIKIQFNFLIMKYEDYYLKFFKQFLLWTFIER